MLPPLSCPRLWRTWIRPVLLMGAVWTLLCAGQVGVGAQAMPEAPVSLPMPPPPPAAVPAGFTSANTARARIHVAPGSAQDADAFARDWGLLIDDGMDQLDAFLTPFPDKLDIYVYPDDVAFGLATVNARWPELEPGPVLANPGVGDLAIDLEAFQRATPLEAENALRHGMAHVAIREASRGRAPRGFDEGLAAYFEQFMLGATQVDRPATAAR